MKRSSSAPCLADGDTVKKVKREPNTREYLQLALARVLELQRAVKDDTYFDDNTSDLGDSDTDEDTMRSLLTKIFKDLPGSSPSVASIIEQATRPPPAELERTRAKSVQLSGYDTCRKVSLEFMKNVVKHTRRPENSGKRRETTNPTTPSDYETRSRMLKSLDLHLAVKQRDYTLKLMRL